jgi:putative restriction endonuclease
MNDLDAEDVLQRFASLRQYQHKGQRYPHKPLLALLALGQLANTGSSELPWLSGSERLAALIAEFAPVSTENSVQRAAYPFTRLRNDGVWTLNHPVKDDKKGELDALEVVGRLEPTLERQLAADPDLLYIVARSLVTANFPDTVAPDVLTAVGLDPESVLNGPVVPRGRKGSRARRRNASWRADVLKAWNLQCAFCGYDGQFGTASVGLDAAHVRWFALDGPDTLDNGIAMCALHHKLFDFGVLGLTLNLGIQVSTTFTARTPAGQAIYELHGRDLLRPRPDATTPAEPYLIWHRTQVFKGEPMNIPRATVNR